MQWAVSRVGVWGLRGGAASSWTCHAGPLDGRDHVWAISWCGRAGPCFSPSFQSVHRMHAAAQTQQIVFAVRDVWQEDGAHMKGLLKLAEGLDDKLRDSVDEEARAMLAVRHQR